MKRTDLILFIIFFSIFSINLLAVDTTLDYGGNALILSSSNTLTASAGSTLTLKNMVLKNLSGDRLIMEAPSSVLVLDNVKITMDGDYSFTQGTLNIQNDVKFTGTSAFGYLSSSTSTIASAATLMFDLDTTFSYAPIGSTSRDLITMTDQTSRLYLNGCSLFSTTTGLRLRTGTLIFDNNVTVSSAGVTLSSAIALGDTQNSIDLNIRLLSGAQVTPFGLIDIK